MKRFNIFLAIVAVSLLFVTQCVAQSGRGDGLSIKVQQDARLALIGDDKGNDAFTLNPMITFGLEGYTFGDAFKTNLIILAEYEYADLAGGEYHRWSVGAGLKMSPFIYARDVWIFRPSKISFTPSLQFGFIDRNGVTMTGLGTIDVSYELFDGFEAVYSAQWTIRTELKGSPIRYSGMFGVKKTFLL